MFESSGLDLEMADVKISDLLSGSPADTDVLETETAGGASRQLTRAQVTANSAPLNHTHPFSQVTTVPTQNLLGRATAGTGNTETLTAAQARTLLNVEDGATADQVAADVPFTPAGTIAATNTQAAVEEVASDAAAATAAKSDITRTINAQTGTTYTFVLGDAGNVVTSGNASATVFTIPTNASVPYAVGSQIDISQIGAGVLTLTGDTGVNVNGVSAGSGALSTQFGSVTLLNLATDEWLLTGNHDAVV